MIGPHQQHLANTQDIEPTRAIESAHVAISCSALRSQNHNSFAERITNAYNPMFHRRALCRPGWVGLWFWVCVCALQKKWAQPKTYITQQLINKAEIEKNETKQNNASYAATTHTDAHM